MGRPYELDPAFGDQTADEPNRGAHPPGVRQNECLFVSRGSARFLAGARRGAGWGRRVGWGPGVAWPKSRCLACEPAAQATALDMLAAAGARMEMLRQQLADAARHLTGAKVLAARLYRAGPVTALALTCWLAGAGRFSSSRKAVRFTGLDITVWSSDRKGPPGRLSRQGPPVLRWALYEAGKPTPGLRLPATATTPPSRTAKTASAPPSRRPASSSGRPATS
jgi:Transposase IS116/IS110/IS902 family